jgi:hypothetical protein
VSNLQWPDKDPGDTLDYDADFSQALPAGDNIDSVVWTIDPPGGTSPLTKVTQTHDDPTLTATIWLSGGDDGVDYTLTCTVTTDSSPPRVFERDIGLNVRNLV